MSQPHELQTIIAGGVPEEALRFFGRWWQLETYLREVVYVELRCRYGSTYVDRLGAGAQAGARRDRVNAYMASADADDPLAYLDAAGLLDLIDEDWGLFEPTLLPAQRWRASADVLRNLRNRVSHCRRPHGDDLGRILQLLRDLEHGARRFYGSYGENLNPPERDPLYKAWVKGRHPAADRLLDHARRQYDTRFQLSYGRRPWAPTDQPARVSGEPGYIWQATWLLGRRVVQPLDLWRRLGERSDLANQVVHLLLPSPYSATATFSSVEPPSGTAEAIGAVFDSLLETSQPNESTDLDGFADWREAARDLPRKVQTYTVLALFDASQPAAIFDAR